MKILLVNTYDSGGAGSACLRLHSGLLQESIDSKVLLKAKQTQAPYTYKLKPILKRISTTLKTRRKFKGILISFGFIKKRTIKKKNTFIENRDKRLEFFTFPDSSFDITSSNLYEEADIINLHWVADFLDYKSFFKKNTKPVVWTIHDMNPFSGGEHYEEEYLGIDQNGYPIIRIVSEIEKKVFKKNIELKLEALNGVKNLHIVTLCKWMNKEVKKSVLFKNFPIHLIPNGIDTSVFKLIDKNYSRELLNLPLDKKIILFVADSIDNNRKGFSYLKKAFENLNNSNLVLCAIGHINEEIQVTDGIIELGFIKDENRMCTIYNAADVFVIPSLMDNLPNTVIESLSCGTPVIGFPVGGIPDMVQDGINGLLAKEISVNALVETINTFLNTMDSFDRDSIRTKAVMKYDLKIQANSYIDLFENILEQ